MTPIGGGPKYLRTLCGHGTHRCSAFFVPYGTFLIAHDSQGYRAISVVRWVVQSRSWAFVDVRDLVMGYVMGYFLTISENKFVLVR